MRKKMSSLFEQINKAIPPTSKGYDCGFRDALDCMLLALGEIDINPATRDLIVMTMLDAYANNFDKGPRT
jgi:hypothetical protein